MFSKQAANSLVTETSQYFVFFCRSVCSANLAKCLIINVLRLIIVILFFIAFLNITYTARHTWATTAYYCEIHPGIISEAMGHTFATLALTQGMPLETLQKVLGHKTIISTQVYAELVNPKIKEDTDKISEKIGGMFRLAN